MNKQEAIKQLKWNTACSTDFCKITEVVEIEKAKEIINQIDEPVKPVVPQVAVEFYEKYKNDSLSFDEWFSDFYSSQFLKDFPQGEELCDWLYDNPDSVNRQRELALATLIVNGSDAVEVEKEKLYRVIIPNPHRSDPCNAKFMLEKSGNKVAIVKRKSGYVYTNKENQLLTESEIKQDFEWLWNVEGAVEEVGG